MRYLTKLFLFASLVIFSSTAKAELVITEIMFNPKKVSDANGEWFEIYNSSASTINLDGYVFNDSDGESFTVGAGYQISSGDYFVLGRNGDFLTNGGVNVDFDYSSFPLN